MKKYLQILAATTLLSASANAASIKQTFKVEIGIFDAAIVDMSYRFENDAYNFSSQIQTSGLFDTFYSFKANYLTSGIFADNSFITQNYEQHTKSSSHTRTKRLIFNKNGILKKRISSKDGVERKVNITLPEKLPDAFDIQTVLLMLITQFKQNNSCDLNRTVFNGKKTYHITIKDQGRILFKDKKVPLSGEAHKCAAFIHQGNTEKGDLLWQVSSERFINFYLMKDKTTELPYLVKMEIASTPLGKLEAYMTDLEIKE